jgi:hypothetical protein
MGPAGTIGVLNLVLKRYRLNAACSELRLSGCPHQVGSPKDERFRGHYFGQLWFSGSRLRFYIDRFRRAGVVLMTGLPIDPIGRLQIGCQQAVVSLQALDDHAVVASLHSVMVRQRG